MAKNLETGFNLPKGSNPESRGLISLIDHTAKRKRDDLSSSSSVIKNNKTIPLDCLRACSVFASFGGNRNVASQFKSIFVAAHHGRPLSLMKKSREKTKIQKESSAAYKKWKNAKQPGDEHLSTQMKSFIQLKELIYHSY